MRHWAQAQQPHFSPGRGGEIRTRNLLNPIQAAASEKSLHGNGLSAAEPSLAVILAEGDQKIKGQSIAKVPTAGLHETPSSQQAEAICIPADLRAAITAWPDLPEGIKQGIVAMVKAAGGRRR